MNKKDQQLIRVLEKEGKLSSRGLAMKTMLPVSTVHRRLRNLEKQGIIKGYRAIVDYEKTDKPVPVLVFINLAETNKEEKYVPVEKIKEELKKINNIYELFDIQGGQWDLIVKARLGKLKDTNQLTEKIRQIQGVEEVSSTIITEESLV